MKAYLCHPHSNNIDLCFSEHDFYLVVESDGGPLVALVPAAEFEEWQKTAGNVKIDNS